MVPLGPAKMGVTAGTTALLLAGIGIALLWGRVPARSRPAAAGLATLAAAAVVAVVVWLDGWRWLEFATGAASLTFGFLAFGRLERGTGPWFRPHTWGLAHGVIGLVAAYVPVLALGVWLVM
jgi:hypothetical protein